MMKARATRESRGGGNSLHSETHNIACLLYYTFTSIEYKGIYLLAWPKYRARYIQCINSSSTSTMNKRKSVLHALLTRILLLNKYVVIRLTPIISV